MKLKFGKPKQAAAFTGVIYNERWPVILKDKEQGEQHSVATISLAVDLPHEIRGTHMSRFVECMQTVGAISPTGLEEVLDKLKEHLQAEKAFIQMEFPYFIYKTSPVTGQRAPMMAEVPVQTLCPCSKEISDYGAHNQRALARIEIEADGLVWIEELAEMADAGASAPVYSLLKRPDEKFVTEKAYDNPRFVEDAVREIALRLEADKRIKWYEVTVESIESIHNHNAFACVEKGWQA